VGSEALSNNDFSDAGLANNNTAVGWEALSLNTDGGGNTAVGSLALEFNQADGLTAVGFNALGNNHASFSNTAVGVGALANNDSSGNTLGNGNTAVGSFALNANIDGGGNTAFGFAALNNNDDSGLGLAGDNTAVGHRALSGNVDGASNVAVGDDALGSNVSGNGNTAVGHDALIDSTGDFNTALGDNAGTDPGIVSNNIFVGDTGFAGDTNVIAIGGIAASGTPYDNCFIGGIAPQAQVTNGTTVCEVSVRFSDGRLGIDCTHPSNPGSAPNSAPLRRSAPQQPHARPAMPNGTVGQVEKLEATVARQQRQIETLTAQLKEQAETFTAQLKEQAAQIQKVSAQLEVSKPAPQVVTNNP
jgi:uncharacterized coiled-coil protein SlyX